MEQTPIYDIRKSYLENFEAGPMFNGALPVRNFPPREEWLDFLGFSIASPLGVPAGPLLNAEWVAFAARVGFDVLTYKTIRSQEHAAHPVPNMVYVDAKEMLAKEDEGRAIRVTERPTSLLAATNSFGMPSRAPGFVIEDIARAQSSLAQGQVMIVSIVGTPRPGENFTEDFVRTALLAKEGGAQILEANFSCPNVTSGEGSLHRHPEGVYQIAHRLKKSIGSTPLIIKLGVIPERDLLCEVMKAAARAGASAVCGVNTLSMEVVKPDGSPALGETRKRAGICGGPIREVALDFLRTASAINREERLGLTLLGTGGVTAPEHFDQFLEAGADVAMSAVGMMWDPLLAMKYHTNKGNSYVEATTR